ncbi:MAG: DUF790 family protein [Bradymonadia bacterium]
MLTADLIRCRVSKDGVLSLVGRSPKHRSRQLDLAAAMIKTVTNNLGRSRDEVLKAFDQITFAPNERKLVLGLRKVLMDECEFEQTNTLDPEALREQVWRLSAEQWRSLSPDAVFDRMRVLHAAAVHFDVAVESIEQALFADLKSAHALVSWSNIGAERLVETYHDAQAQAVFLKAATVKLELKPHSAVELRRFFHLLKFRGLLFRVEARGDKRIHLVIDGPISLFNQTSRYGLKLATLVPRLVQFGDGVARAQLSWGKYRKKVLYEHRFTHQKSGGRSGESGSNEALEKLVSGWCDDVGWRVEVVTGSLVEVAGQALVPDIKCTHLDSNQFVYLELMGFWSRDAVWQRVELASRLKTPFVFLVSERLRVSEKVLDGEEKAALFVFKGVINRKRLVEKLDSLL